MHKSNHKAEPSQSKKPYSQPSLKVYGTVEKMTQNTNNGGPTRDNAKNGNKTA